MGSNSPAICGVLEKDLLYDLFGKLAPEIDYGGIDETGDDHAGVADPALANGFSEGAVHSAGMIGGPLKERDGRITLEKVASMGCWK